MPSHVVMTLGSFLLRMLKKEEMQLLQSHVIVPKIGVSCHINRNFSRSTTNIDHKIDLLSIHLFRPSPDQQNLALSNTFSSELIFCDSRQMLFISLEGNGMGTERPSKLIAVMFTIRVYLKRSSTPILHRLKHLGKAESGFASKS